MARFFAHRRFCAPLALAAATLLACAGAAAQGYPSRPITLVVPFPPGALTDLLGRAMGQKLSDSLKVPVLIDNKAGAGTLIAADAVAKAAPDGHTLMVATSTTMGISPALYRNPAADPMRDLVPVAQVGYVNFFLIATKEFPAKDVQGVIDEVRRNPGRYNYASVGNGSPHQLFMEVIKTQFGLDIQHVPYKGTVAAIPDVLSGKIHVMFSDATVAVPQIQAGKVTAIATSAARQNQLLPAVRPVAETIPGFDWMAWQGLAAPVRTPREILLRLNAEVKKMLESPEFRDQLARFAMEPAPVQSLDEFGGFVRRDSERWSKAVRDSGAKLD